MHFYNTYFSARDKILSFYFSICLFVCVCDVFFTFWFFFGLFKILLKLNTHLIHNTTFFLFPFQGIFYYCFSSSVSTYFRYILEFLSISKYCVCCFQYSTNFIRFIVCLMVCFCISSLSSTVFLRSHSFLMSVTVFHFYFSSLS